MPCLFNIYSQSTKLVSTKCQNKTKYIGKFKSSEKALERIKKINKKCSCKSIYFSGP